MSNPARPYAAALTALRDAFGQLKQSLDHLSRAKEDERQHGTTDPATFSCFKFTSFAEARNSAVIDCDGAADRVRGLVIDAGQWLPAVAARHGDERPGEWTVKLLGRLPSRVALLSMSIDDVDNLALFFETRWVFLARLAAFEAAGVEPLVRGEADFRNEDATHPAPTSREDLATECRRLRRDIIDGKRLAGPTAADVTAWIRGVETGDRHTDGITNEEVGTLSRLRTQAMGFHQQGDMPPPLPPAPIRPDAAAEFLGNLAGWCSPKEHSAKALDNEEVKPSPLPSRPGLGTWATAADLAAYFGLNADQMNGKLRRLTTEHPDYKHEVEGVSKGTPRVVYLTSKVIPLLSKDTTA